MKVLAIFLGCLSAFGCGSSADTEATNGSPPHLAGSKEASASSFQIGVNVSVINNWAGNRAFLNLIYGSNWQMQNTNPWGGYQDIPASSLDANGWVRSVPAGYRVIRALSVPLQGGAFICHFRGNGKLLVSGAAVSDVNSTAGATRFKLAATYPNPQPAILTYSVDPTNYMRDIDCRESVASVTDQLAPEFTSAISGFKVIRFMDWQSATASNARVSWNSRNKPGDADYLRNDGVPVELIVQLANGVGADPWVTMPWNADDDYINRYATYVRDNLAANRRVYVEVSNEVWNAGSSVGVQACNEAKAKNLPGINGGVGCNLERYADKTKAVMRIWSKAFSGQEQRLVRVAALQHVSPYWTNAVLPYEGLYQSVDALATAPYFGGEITEAMNVDQAMSSLHDDVTKVIGLANQQKRIAQKFGLRYVTYEGGQGIVLANNVSLEQKIERDPRISNVYEQFLASWRAQVGDSLNLYNLAGGISKYGAWGLSEYVGQPLAEAPKARAVRSFLSSGKAPLTSSPVRKLTVDSDAARRRSRSV